MTISLLLPVPQVDSASPPPPPIRQVDSPLQYEILFQEPDNNVPEPLPCIETIEAAPVKDGCFGRLIAFVGASFVVKYGYEVESLEAENMNYVRQHTNIRVPQVYAVYQRCVEPEARRTYIIMEKIAGDSLDKLWDGLSSAQKGDIVQQLKKSFTCLRGLPHPGFFGSLDGSKLRDFLFAADEPMPTIDSPFKTEEALVDGLVDRFLAEGPDRLRHQAAYYRKVLPKVLKGNGQPVFAHADLQLKNIMLQPDGWIVMIDWAASGWYPTYWEYAYALCAHRGWSNDWHLHIGLFLEEFPNHFAWMSRLHQDRWY